MWKILPFAIVQSALLAGGQVFLKLAMANMPPFSWTARFFGKLFVNWQFAACGLSFLGASLLWVYMLRMFPLSVVYPMASLCYVFGMIAALTVFHEDVSTVKWIGVALIMAGCCLIVK